jgi:hypothetical protein
MHLSNPNGNLYVSVWLDSINNSKLTFIINKNTVEKYNQSVDGKEDNDNEWFVLYSGDEEKNKKRIKYQRQSTIALNEVSVIWLK